jgi:hypothetical protein
MPQVERAMLRIEKESDGCVTRLLLSGRIHPRELRRDSQALIDRYGHKRPAKITTRPRLLSHPSSFCRA